MRAGRHARVMRPGPPPPPPLLMWITTRPAPSLVDCRASATASVATLPDPQRRRRRRRRRFSHVTNIGPSSCRLDSATCTFPGKKNQSQKQQQPQQQQQQQQQQSQPAVYWVVPSNQSRPCFLPIGFCHLLGFFFTEFCPPPGGPKRFTGFLPSCT